MPNASQAEAAQAGNGLVDSFLSRFRAARPAADAEAAPAVPSMLEVLATSLNIMQVRITQSRLAGEPADVLIRPRLSDIAITDFHRSAVSIAEGVRAAEHALPMIREMLG